MKKMINKFSFLFTLITPFYVYAADAERLDRIMLEAILTFLQYVSWPILAIAIGMFIYSIKNEDGAGKTDSIKVFGLAIFLQSLLFIARASGLC